MMTEREKNIFEAKLAAYAERYDETLEAMKKVASMKEELTPEERNLLSVTCKSVVGARRSAWKAISRIEQKEATKGFAEKHKISKSYREQLENELRDICSDILNVINNHLIPCESATESKIFNYQILGDIHRYISELPDASAGQDDAETSALAYKTAYNNAKLVLAPTHPIRLRLGLKLSVACYNIMESPEQAIQFAEDAFDNAISEWDLVSEENFEESDKIMQRLVGKLSRWKSDIKAHAGGKEEKRL